jgi:hypothetical protein
MASSPIMAALVQQRLHEVNGAEAGLRTFVSEKLGAPPPAADPPADFQLWCDNKRVLSRPATPASVAAFILEQHQPKISRLLETIRAISASHCDAGMSDPVSSWQPMEALLKLIKVEEPPRSWPPSERMIFLSLPPDLQRYLIVQDKGRDAIFRQKMNEVADARKQLLKEMTPHEPTEEKPDENRAA